MAAITTKTELELGNARLLKLASFVRKEVAPDEFELEYFVSDSAELKADRLGRLYMQHCGSPGCALAWATHVWPEQFWFAPARSPTFGKYVFCSKEFDDGREFFAIDEEDWGYLFNPRCSRTPEEQAKAMEEFVEQRKSGDWLLQNQ